MEWLFGTVVQGRVTIVRGSYAGGERRDLDCDPAVRWLLRFEDGNVSTLKNAPSGNGGHRTQGTLNGFIEVNGCGEVLIWYHPEQLHDRAMLISKPMITMDQFRSRNGWRTSDSLDSTLGETLVSDLEQKPVFRSFPNLSTCPMIGTCSCINLPRSSRGLRPRADRL